jgi:hypothetical protein
MRALVLCLSVSACGFAPALGPDGGARGDDGAGSGSADASQAVPGPLHLTRDDGQPSDVDLVLTGNLVVDTSALSITSVLLDPAVFDVRHQVQGDGEVAVLHLHSLTVAAGATIQVVGARPLIVVASDAIVVSGRVDAGAHATTPGPGGFGPGLGAGAGRAGTHQGAYSDSGGGGGGFGDHGGAGGAITGCATALPGGLAGASQGDDPISVLAGGAGGGAGESTACPDNLGGAGGGAIQLTSDVSVFVDETGVITAGGGGGRGGTDCGGSDGNSGAGGGAGGAIVLQAPSVTNQGVIAANGGGGGGSGSGGAIPPDTGNPGEDGHPSDVLALGGGGIGPSGIDGGAGAIADTAAQAGMANSCTNNAGGGGGAVGRIAASTGYQDLALTSPHAIATLPL